MTLPATLKWIGLALLGIAIAAAVAFAAGNLASRQIGLASEPISAGDALAPVGGSNRDVGSKGSGNGSGGGGGSDGNATAPSTGAPTASPAVTTPESTTPSGSDDSGDDSGGGHGDGHGADD